MKLNLDKLTQKLLDLDKKAEEFDKLITDLRIEINDVFWDLVEMRKEKDIKNDNKKQI